MLAVLAFNMLLPRTSASGSVPQYIEEFAVPTANSAPLAVTVDERGIVWFTESNASKLGRFDPSSRIFQEYAVGGVGDMWGVTVDGRGYVWLTQYSGKGSVNPGGAIVPGGQGRLVRFDPASKNFTFVDIPTVGSFPMRLVCDERNRVWFTEFLGNKIGVFDRSSNTLIEYNIPTNASGTADLTFDKQGSLWFTEAYARKVAKFNVEDRSFVEYPLESNDPSQVVSSPVGIAVAQNGGVWIADHGGNWIVEFNAETRKLVRYPTHTPTEDAYPISIPNGLLIDGNGRVWFTEHGGNSIGYVNPETQTMVEFPIPTGPISTALWIASAPNGDIWFTEWSTNKIGVVHASLPVPLSIRIAQDHLRLEPGEQTSISLLTKSSQDIPGNGTFRYTWSSYNPQELSVAFSPQYPPLTGLADVPAQVQLGVSSKISFGNYTLGFGVDAGTVLVWSFIQTEVVPATAMNMAFFENQVVLFVVVSLLAAALGVWLFRARSTRARKSH